MTKPGSSRPLTIALLSAALCGGNFLSPTVRAAETEAKASSDTAYAQEIETFRNERTEGLKKPEGWLSLVGLFWLEEGANRFGSGAENRVIFPEGSAPELVGTFVRHGQKVSVESRAGLGPYERGQAGHPARPFSGRRRGRTHASGDRRAPLLCHPARRPAGRAGEGHE